MSNCNKNTIFVEANVMNISTKFQLHPPSEEKIFEYFFANLAFRLQWQPIKFRDADAMVSVIAIPVIVYRWANNIL